MGRKRVLSVVCMTRDEKIAWLRRYLEADREIDRLTESVAKWRSRAEGLAGSVIEAPSGGDAKGQDIMPQAIEYIADIKDKIIVQMARQEAIKAEVEAAIDRLLEPRYREVLRCRYLRNLSIGRIAVEMKYSYRQIVRYHKNALVELYVEGVK